LWLINTGNVSLTGVTPTDTFSDGTVGTLTGPVTDTGNAGVLDVAETWTYNISLPVTQATVDAGTDLVNTVEVVSNETGTTPVSDTASTEFVRTPSFTVKKAVDKSTVSAPGLLSYSVVIENTGNVSLTNVVVTDQLSNGSVIAATGPASDVGINGALDIGESWNYTATYNVTQDDIDAGIDLTNTVTVDTSELDDQLLIRFRTVRFPRLPGLLRTLVWREYLISVKRGSTQPHTPSDKRKSMMVDREKTPLSLPVTRPG